MVTLSAAHSYALISRKPDSRRRGHPGSLFLHLDRTDFMSLVGAVHNADRGRVPVLIYAGASPFSSEGKPKGSRNEYIH
jgi:hypothetical protein